MKATRFFTLPAISLMLFASSSVEAQSVFPMSPSYSKADDVSLDDEDTIQAYFHRNKSYECVLLTRDFETSATDEFYIFETSAKDPEGETIAVVANGDDYPAVTPVDGVSAFHSRTRISHIAEKTGTHKFTVEDVFADNGSEPTTIRCRETSLYGGYNRFFAGVAIVELRNASSKNIDTFITIIDSSGNTVVDKQEATAVANTRTDVIFNSLPSGNFGQIIITHRAPYGALSGTVAEYDFNSDGSITLKRERPLENAQRR